MTGSEAGAPSLAGHTLAQYQVGEWIGKGELGTVYAARDTATGRDVALETLPANSRLDADRLRQEVHAALALDHPAVARTYEFGTAAELNFVAREPASGRTLEQTLGDGPIAFDAALEIARQIAAALAAGHAIGITHRHLNSRNIVLTGGNRVKLVNFGLSVPPGEAGAEYLAPEQRDGRGADARADIYSFGLVLRHMFGPVTPKPLEPVITHATRKNPARRYQLMEDVGAALDRVAADPEAAAKDRGHRTLLAAGALVLAVVAAGWWILGGRSAMNQGPAALTSDAGLTTDGAISADGRTIVYASDRGSPGILNLWLRPVGGGTPSRLTQGPDDDDQPVFSPDAARVAFRSERDGGGVYLVATSGGLPQLLVKGGRNPRFSPDGRWIAYWTAGPRPEEAAVWVIASSGGQPSRLHGQFADARYPVWSPDGKRLIFAARVDESGRNADWYVTSIAGGSTTGEATRTGAESLLHMQAIRENAVPELWAAGQVILSGRMTPMGKQLSGEPRLLRIPISPDIMQATGAAHEITSGADWDSYPSLAAGGRLVFSRRALKAEIWSMAADGSGEPRRMTQDAGDARPAASRDGSRLAYRVPLADGKSEIRVVESEGGKRIATVTYEAPREWPVLLSTAGDEMVYSGDGVMRKRLPDGTPERIARRGWQQATSWSSDGRYLLVQRGWRGLGILDVTTGRDREILRDDRFPILEARFSPDDKWIAFTLAVPRHHQIFVAPLLADGGARIALTGEETAAGSPAWSPDGGRIYYVAACQGFRCIWARQLDPHSRKPQGDAFPVRHFHRMRYSLINSIDPQNVGLVAAGDRLIFGMFEMTGNVWSLPSLPRP